MLPEDIFANEPTPLSLVSNGLVQTIGPGIYNILAKFDDGKPAIANLKSGKGSLYYLAAPLKSGDYHLLLSALAQKLRLKRPVVGIDKTGNLITGAEVRAVERCCRRPRRECLAWGGRFARTVRVPRTMPRPRR